MADVLLRAFHRIGFRHAGFAEATCGAIRIRMRKSGALVTTDRVALAS